MSFPVWGEYLVAKINPTATLGLLLDDPQVIKECEEFQQKTYVLCCLREQGIANPGYYCPLQVSLVSHGLVAGPKDNMLPEMYMAVCPNTSHPRSRKPLKCSPPLPWDNCYSSTIAVTTVRMACRDRTIRTKAKFGLPSDDAFALYFQAEFDRDWQMKLDRMRETGGTDFEPDGPIDPFGEDEEEEEEGLEEDVESYSDSDIEDAEGTPESEKLSHDDSTQHAPTSPSPYEGPTLRDAESTPDLDHESLHSSVNIVMEELMHRFDFTPVVDYSMDLEELPACEIANPWDFFEDVEALKMIHARYIARVQAKIDEAAKLDADLDAKVNAELLLAKINSRDRTSPDYETRTQSTTCISNGQSPDASLKLEKHNFVTQSCVPHSNLKLRTTAIQTARSVLTSSWNELAHLFVRRA